MKLSLSMNYLLTSCNNKQNIIMIVWIMSWSKTLEKAHSPPLTFFFVKFEEQVKCSCLVHTPPHLNHLPETFSHSLTLWYSFSLYLFIFHSYSYCSFIHHFCFISSSVYTLLEFESEWFIKLRSWLVFELWSRKFWLWNQVDMYFWGDNKYIGPLHDTLVWI